MSYASMIHEPALGEGRTRGSSVPHAGSPSVARRRRDVVPEPPFSSYVTMTSIFDHCGLFSRRCRSSPACRSLEATSLALGCWLMPRRGLQEGDRRQRAAVDVDEEILQVREVLRPVGGPLSETGRRTRTAGGGS